MSFFNQTEDTIIDILNSKNIDRISMAGIIGTLRQENLSETLLETKKIFLLRTVLNKYGI
mgnify:CR=1 FL=1